MLCSPDRSRLLLVSFVFVLKLGSLASSWFLLWICTMHFDFDLKSQIYLDDESGEKKNEWIMSNLRLRIQTTPFNCQSTLIGFCWIVIVWMLLKNFFFFLNDSPTRLIFWHIILAVFFQIFQIQFIQLVLFCKKKNHSNNDSMIDKFNQKFSF